MQCVVIGVGDVSPQNDGDVFMNTMSKQVTNVNGSQVNWVSSSMAHEKDGTPSLLLACVTDASDQAVIEAVSNSLPDYACEVWGSAPAILPLKPFEGYDRHIFYDNATTFEEWTTITIKQWGMFVQKDLLAADEVTRLRQTILDEIGHAEELIKVHHPNIRVGKDMMSFREIASRGNERFDLMISSTSAVTEFVSTVINPRISYVISQIVGQIDVEVDCDISVVYSKPGAPNQGWHADGDHQKGASDAGLDRDGWKSSLSDPYAICLFIPLIDLNDETGYTQFWPASHRNKGLAGFGAFAEIADATWNGKCNAGSAIWYDYRLMHRGIKNESTVLRPVLQLLFKKKWYAEKRNYGEKSLIPLDKSLE